MASRALPVVISLLTACSDAGEPVVLEPAAAPRAESDEPASFHARADDVELGRVRASVALADGRHAVVDERARLVLLEGRARRVLLDEVVGQPAALDDGRVLAARATEPGESDLWLVDTASGLPPRALAAARGADGQPFALDDGRVLFVSDRTGVASLFVVALDGGGLVQLTNAGVRPGKLGDGFVPPPVRVVEQRGDRVIYDAGDALWSLDVVTGAAEVLR